MTYERYLKSIYYNPGHPAAFSGVDKLYRAIRKEGKYVLGKAKIKKWLLKQEPYTVHRQVIRKQKRQQIVVPYIDYQWEADVAYMTSYSKYNDDYGYFLLVIDVFSKFVWTFPLKHVRGNEVARAFERILDSGRRPDKVRTDIGSEFKSLVFKKLLKNKGIEHFYAFNETKAAVAERAIKTIKSKIARYMTTKQTHRWIDSLGPLTESYNLTYHRSLKMAPRQVKPRNEKAIWQFRFEQLPKKINKRGSTESKYHLRVGDHVRISHLRRTFQREYEERWTTEYFTVTSRGRKQGIPFYKLVDLQGDAIDGSFYGHELSKVHVDDSTTYRIGKVLRYRKNEVFVQWKGWPNKFNSWIPRKDLVDYRKN